MLTVIQELKKQGHSVIITARDFAQTIQLAEKFGIEYTVIGKHGGKSLYGKGLNLINHSISLMKWAKDKDIDLAISHNSYSQSLAAFLAKIPSITIMDYEYQPANHLSFRLAKRVIVPESFPEKALRTFGAKPYKVRKFPGLKEDAYLSHFAPEADFLNNSGLDSKKVIVSVRPPATFALYHRFENQLFDELLQWLIKNDNVLVILLPRTNEQREVFLKNHYPNTIIPPKVLDGPNLLFHSDLAISAGGTMNREAVVLGTPVYTVFAGEIPAVDNYLIKMGKMLRIQNIADFQKIKVEKKVNGNFRFSDQSSLEKILEFILDFSGK